MNATSAATLPERTASAEQALLDITEHGVAIIYFDSQESKPLAEAMQ